jgi:hypothetical protein
MTCHQQAHFVSCHNTVSQTTPILVMVGLPVEICHAMMGLMVSVVGTLAGVCNGRHHVRCKCSRGIFCNNETTPLITHLRQTSLRLMVSKSSKMTVLVCTCMRRMIHTCTSRLVQGGWKSLPIGAVSITERLGVVLRYRLTNFL